MPLISNLFKSYCYGIGNLYGEYIESLFIMLKLLSRLYHSCCHSCTTAVVTAAPQQLSQLYHSYGTVVTLTVVRPCHTSVQLSSEMGVQPSAEQSFQQSKGMVGKRLHDDVLRRPN